VKIISSIDANAVRTYNTSVSLRASDSGRRWDAEVYVRGIKGLFYYEAEYHGSRPTSVDLYYDTYLRGIFSPRPFQLDQLCDPSAVYCVLSSFESACHALNLRPEIVCAAASTAHDPVQVDFRTVREHASWEGIVHEKHWDSTAILKLLAALVAVGAENVATALEAHVIPKPN
jgi:hypothetical protein